MQVNCSRISLIAVLLCFCCVSTVRAQDSLPQFTAYIKGKNRIQISWINPYGSSIKQLSIQRSRDSARLYKTIISMPDPTVLENGFMDQNLPDTNFYYRIYIMLDGGDYVFSPVRKAESAPAKPVPQPTVQPSPQQPVKPNQPSTAEPVKPAPKPEKWLVIKRDEELLGELNEKKLQAFRDSVSMTTKDTILLLRDTIFIRPFKPKEYQIASKYIFMDKVGLIHVEFPWFAHRKYQVRFFEEDKVTPLFEIRDIRDATLLLDKGNFMQAGWYYFEIYEDGKLLEKNRIFITRDF